MPSRVKCPNCATSLNIPDRFSGKKVRCPRCQHVFQIGETTPPSASTTEPGAEPSMGQWEPETPQLPVQTYSDAVQSLPRPQAASPPPMRENTTDLPQRSYAPIRPKRQRTPAFVWLVPLFFLALFVGFGALGSVLISTNDEPQGRGRGINRGFPRKVEAKWEDKKGAFQIEKRDPEPKKTSPKRDDAQLPEVLPLPGNEATKKEN